MSNEPRVFLSHASEDKERFVIKFATALRENGVDVWLDQWEMRPGDKLVKKLFDEGLKQAEAVIIVISSCSINKPWVREELDAAMVAHVSRKMRIIPVVIDDCEIPEPLKSTVWERVQDTQDFKGALHRVLDSIFGRTDKPPLGHPPTSVTGAAIPGLTGTDTMVLQAFYDHMVKTNAPVLQPEVLFENVRPYGIAKDSFCESLLILGEKYLLDLKKATQSPFARIVYMRATYSGFMAYSEHFLSHFSELKRSVALQIINHGTRANVTLAEALRMQQFVADYILEHFSILSWITLSSKRMSGYQQILDVSPSLKREYS